MWLIHVETLKLHAFIPPDLPKYAILSHTWGLGEVTFQEFADLDTARDKAGFTKIEMTCKLALENGLEWAWVDTCCIDKSSSAELSEAINSMFEWYRLSTVCFAHLEDLPTAAPTLWPDEGLHRVVCRWFERGWTLQELIAPARLEFFDCEWRARGTKTDPVVLRQLSSMTGIRGPSARVLRNAGALAEISVGERMSWASRRRTTRVEDMAYCLLGIFQVNMPMLYGEGPRAFQRLQEEILKSSTDMSLFCWTAQPGEDPDHQQQQPYRGVLARHPSEFATWFDTELTSRKSISWAMCEQEKEFASTNKGIRMEATLASFYFKGENRTCLRCTLFPDDYVVFVPLRYHRDNIYVRELPDTIMPSRTTRYETKTIYLAKDVDHRMSSALRETAAEALGVDASLLPAVCAMTATESWPKAQWNAQRQEFALTSSRLFSCILVYGVRLRGAEVGRVVLICQHHSSALQPLRYALIPYDEATGILAQIRGYENGGGQDQPVEAFSMMEQFIIDGRQAVEMSHDGAKVSLFVTRYSESGGASNKLFLKMTSQEDLLHPLPVGRTAPKLKLGDGMEPGLRLGRAPQIHEDGGVPVVQPELSPVAGVDSDDLT